MSQPQKLCDFCHKPIKWPDKYQRGMKPVNLDDTVHDCRSTSEVQNTQTSTGRENNTSATAEKSLVVQASKRVKIIITIEVIPDV